MTRKPRSHVRILIYRERGLFIADQILYWDQVRLFCKVGPCLQQVYIFFLTIFSYVCQSLDIPHTKVLRITFEGFLLNLIFRSPRVSCHSRRVAWDQTAFEPRFGSVRKTFTLTDTFVFGLYSGFDAGVILTVRSFSLL